MTQVIESFNEQKKSLQEMYKLRLSQEHAYRVKLYEVLCGSFFQKFIPEDCILMEIASGHCEFINTINAKRKIALDLNPDVKKYADAKVEVIEGLSTDMSMLQEGTIDRIFTSNFFEHISREDIRKTLKEAHRVLKPNGKMIILQPNFRYCMKDYYMFFDHITEVDDRALCEVLELTGYKIELCLPRFLPYTTKSKIPKVLFLVKLYLKFPFLFKIFGQQAFIIAQKAA